jgi:RNA polymerase sigma-70 factor (ECF subfamily)
MRAGDPQALDRATRELGPRLMRVALRCCRSPADAEDAVQMALLEASRGLGSYRGEGSPLAWLSTLVARSCYRLNDHAARQPVSGTDHGEGACDCLSPERAVHEKRLGEALADALMELPRVDRLVLLLAAHGWRGPEIAAEFDLTHDAVRGRLKRARKAVRAALMRTLDGDTLRSHGRT